MATEPATAPPRDSRSPIPIGVGIDTARYGHYATFLRDDLQPAADELAFTESAHGYDQLRSRLQRIAQRYPAVAFHIRLDAAGPYADNLLHFLRQLPHDAQQPGSPFRQATFTLSQGDPQRNKNYRAALFGSQKSDPVEARAAARFALREQPAPAPQLSPEQRALRHVAGRLQAAVRQRTRLVNQLHHLLAQTFPELALLVEDLATGWALELVHRYPTAPLLAAAGPDDLAAIAYLPEAQVAPLLTHARCSVGSFTGASAAALVRDQVRQVRDTLARQKRLETLLIDAYQGLPKTNHLDTIKGIGPVTAAVLTAFILDIDRFASPNQLVAYFGTLPLEVSSGVDRDGRPHGPRRYVMSRRGNDLVRRYLWMAALSASQHNPAVRALYRRVAAKHPEHKAIAVGHAMRKLLHLVYAVWKSDRPFDPQHYPWEGPTPATGDQPARVEQAPAAAEASQAAGHKPEAKPAEQVVTAACEATVPPEASVGEGTFVDFAHLKQQLSMARLLEHLGLLARLRGRGEQRRCACPLHRGDGRSRTFSVNLEENVFHCFDARCGKEGDVLDLWAALHQLDLRTAALDLVQTFGLEPAPRTRTEKRHG